MALFNHIDELKKYVAVNASLRLDDLLAFVNRAEALHIKPILGKELYLELKNAYENGEALSIAQKALLALCQDATANFAMLLYIPHGLTQINAAGVHQKQNSTSKPATPEQVKKLENSYAATAYSALDDLLEHLEENAAEYPLYEAAEGKKFLLHSTRQFSKYVNIGASRRTYIALQPIMQRIETTQIRKILGVELFKAVKKVHEGNFTGAAEDKAILEELLDQVRPLIAYRTIEKGMTELAVMITDTGLHLYSSSSTYEQMMQLPADAKRIENLRLEYLEEAQQAEKELMDYLYSKTEELPQFKLSGAYIEPKQHQDQNSISNRYYIA